MYLINNDDLEKVISSLSIATQRELYDELDADAQTDEDTALAVQHVQDMVGESIEEYQNCRDETILEDYADEYELD